MKYALVETAVTRLVFNLAVLLTENRYTDWVTKNGCAKLKTSYSLMQFQRRCVFIHGDKVKFSFF